MSNQICSPLFFLLTVASLTVAVGHRFYNQPRLAAGTQAPRTIVAPESAVVEDKKTTEERRKAARVGAVPILTIDIATDEKIYEDIHRQFEKGDELRAIAGKVPFVKGDRLTPNTQLYLRQAPLWEWKAILNALQLQPEDGVSDGLPLPIPQGQEGLKPPADGADREDVMGVLRQGAVTGLYQGLLNLVDSPLKEQGKQALQELQWNRENSSEEEFRALLSAIVRARQRYFEAVSTLTAEARSSTQGGGTEAAAVYDTGLLDLPEQAWGNTQEGILKAAEYILAQGIPAGLPDRVLLDSITLHVKLTVPPQSQELARNLLLQTLQPNLVEDEEQTRIQAEQAALAVDPVMVSVDKGEVIVRAGEEITASDFVLLDRFQLTQRAVNWPGLIGLGGVVAGTVGIFLVVERRYARRLSRMDRCLVWILTLSAPLITLAPLPLLSLPAIGLLVGSFYGSILGATTVALLAAVLPVGLEVSTSYLVAAAASGIVGGLLASRMRSREELALLGVGVGLTQGTVYLMTTLIASASAATVWYVVLSGAALYGLAGVAWSVVALGLSPYLEHVFDLVTPIRLAELANPNRPLLQRLAAEAPGTFQHTLFVASLAEAAAKALRCNVELVRAGTLYHDIGKMHDPMGFIENQMGRPNKHDEIADPWLSAKIIRDHVTEGLVMARRCRLPKAVRAFIPEHQGTMLIAYFYHQALQQAAERGLEVQEEDFRYPGPIPQSRETGIVMLADSCEAALRSLKDATPEEALNLVKKIVRSRLQDDQLVNSGLTKEELYQISEIFVQVWQQFHHKRIAYPKAALAGKSA